MPIELRLPSDVSNLTQDQYDLYIKEVKAILFQLPQLQSLVTLESLNAVTNYEIVSIPQASGGILVQLRAVPSPLEIATEAAASLSPVELAQFRSWLESL